MSPGRLRRRSRSSESQFEARDTNEEEKRRDELGFGDSIDLHVLDVDRLLIESFDVIGI